MYIVQNAGDEPVSKHKSTDLKAYFLIINYEFFEKGSHVACADLKFILWAGDPYYMSGGSEQQSACIKTRPFLVDCG